MIAGQIHQQANTGLNIADYQEIKIRLSRFETKGATTLKTFGVKRLRNTKSLVSLCSNKSILFLYFIILSSNNELNSNLKVPCVEARNYGLKAISTSCPLPFLSRIIADSLPSFSPFSIYPLKRMFFSGNVAIILRSISNFGIEVEKTGFPP